jgi:hypothetical protein
MQKKTNLMEKKVAALILQIFLPGAGLLKVGNKAKPSKPS